MNLFLTQVHQYYQAVFLQIHAPLTYIRSENQSDWQFVGLAQTEQPFQLAEWGHSSDKVQLLARRGRHPSSPQDKLIVGGV